MSPPFVLAGFGEGPRGLSHVPSLHAAMIPPGVYCIHFIFICVPLLVGHCRGERNHAGASYLVMASEDGLQGNQACRMSSPGWTSCSCSPTGVGALLSPITESGKNDKRDCTVM